MNKAGDWDSNVMNDPEHMGWRTLLMNDIFPLKNNKMEPEGV